MMALALAGIPSLGRRSAVDGQGGVPGGARPFGEVRTSPSAHLSPHTCGVAGARMLFVREASGHSFERCSGCGWAYDFDRSRASDASALVGWVRG